MKSAKLTKATRFNSLTQRSLALVFSGLFLAAVGAAQADTTITDTGSWIDPGGNFDFNGQGGEFNGSCINLSYDYRGGDVTCNSWDFVYDGQHFTGGTCVDNITSCNNQDFTGTCTITDGDYTFTCTGEGGDGRDCCQCEIHESGVPDASNTSLLLFGALTAIGGAHYRLRQRSLAAVRS